MTAKYQMSVSRFRAFMDCPSAAVAYVRGEYKRTQTQAMLLGNYIGCALLTPDLLPSFMDENKAAMFAKKGGELLKAFADADRLVAEVRRDARFMESIAGQPEEPITFDYDGVVWNARPDIYDRATRTLIDLKRVGGKLREYDERIRRFVPWYDGAIGTSYWFQLAIYREGVKKRDGDYPANVALAALIGADPVGREIVNFANDARFTAEAICASELQHRFVAMQDGKEAAPRGPVIWDEGRGEPIFSTVCRCDWCRREMMEQPAESWM